MHGSKKFPVIQRLDEEADRTDLGRNRPCGVIFAARL